MPFAALTLLSGLNGSGKSSIMQSLLLVRQLTLQSGLQPSRISFSGEYVDLGRGRDVLFTSATNDAFAIGVKDDAVGDVRLEFQVERETGDTAWTTHDSVRKDATQLALDGFALFSGVGGAGRLAEFNYLNAERFGPRKALPTEGSRGQAFNLGAHGEYVLDALLVHQDRITLSSGDPRRIEGAEGDRLRDQLDAWLAEISPGVRLAIAGVPNADLAVGSFSFGREGELRSPEYRATNVGFGLSYILPVLAALLSAPQGGLVLIENPEAHLHPRGQTKMGELCARAAAAGVQVIIETHSDHVLDGARLSVRGQIVAPKDLRFHYLFQNGGKAERRSPSVDADGRLSEWPEGFFDQHRRNAAGLVRPRAN